MNSRFFRFLVLALLLIGVVVTSVYALEADKEVRILCGLFQPGLSETEMDRILGTAHFLRVDEPVEGQRGLREVYSAWNLGRNGCRVELADGLIIGSEAWNGFNWLGRG
jgi:hypothetical protein